MIKKKKRWAWVLTGSGHFFNETIDLINEIRDVDIFISKAAEEVLVMYKKKGNISDKIKIFRDNSASSATVGKFMDVLRKFYQSKFYNNHYHTLIMGPASSNTVAKCVYGISDSLASNVFAQAGKCRVYCIYFPCDTAPELKTLSPKGMVDVYPRKIDLENVEKLKFFSDTYVAMSFDDFKKKILKRRKNV